jgi:hypothetical protein
MRDRPLCFGCRDQVDHDPVYEAPCGHEDCPSCVFHPLCLMKWREWREARTREFRSWLERLSRDHGNGSG